MITYSVLFLSTAQENHENEPVSEILQQKTSIKGSQSRLTDLSLIAEDGLREISSLRLRLLNQKPSTEGSQSDVSLLSIAEEGKFDLSSPKSLTLNHAGAPLVLTWSLLQQYLALQIFLAHMEKSPPGWSQSTK